MPRYALFVPRLPSVLLSIFTVILLGAIPCTASAAVATTTTLVASSSTASVGGVVTFTATVKDSSNAFVLKGQVLFCYSSVTTCNVGNAIGSTWMIKTAGAAQGTAVLRTRFGIGTKQVRAFYIANSSYQASSSSAQLVTVTRTVTQPVLLDTVQDYTNFPNTKFTTFAGTAGPASQANPTGTVAFKDTADTNYSLGTGTLGTTASLHFGGAKANNLTGGNAQYVDVNNDGILDAVYAGDQFVGSNVSFGVFVALGNADGTFQTPTFTAVSTQQSPSFTLADLNGDGYVDMVDSLNQVLLNNGSGGFTLQGPVITSSGYQDTFVAVGDVDGDGIPDLIYASQNCSCGSLTFVQLGVGDGTFGAAGSNSTSNNILNSSVSSSNIVVGDFNKDGKLDIAVTTPSSVVIAFGNGTANNTFNAVAPTTYSLPSSSNVYKILATDLNNDGNIDLLVSDSLGPAYLIGSANGTFSAATQITLVSPNGGLTVADVNGDGFLDILATENPPTNGTIQLDPAGYYVTDPTGGAYIIDTFLNSGTGTFPVANLKQSFEYSGGGDLVDVNGDGIPDLVANYYTPSVTLYGEQAVSASVTANVPGVNYDANYGLETIVGNYSGDGTYAAGAAPALNTVAGTIGTDSIALTNTPNPLSPYQYFTLTATVTHNTVGNFVIGGTVTFKDANETQYPACTNVPVNASGVATCSSDHFGALQTSQPGYSDTYTAVYTGDNVYPTVTSTGLTVAPVNTIPCTINWSPTTPIPYGTALSGAQLNASATYGSFGYTQAGTYTYSPVSGTVLPLGANTVSVNFTPTGSTPRCAAKNGTTTTITVVKATPTITFTGIANHTTTDAPFNISATSTSGVTPTIVVTSGPATLSGNTITLTQVTGTVTLTATTPSSTNYNAGSQTATFNVTAGTPTITFGTIAAHTYGDAPFAVTATSNSGVTPTIVVTSGPATISGGNVTITGAGTVTLTATTPASANFAAGSQTAVFTVAQATPVVTFTTVSAHTYGDAPFSASATSTSGVTPTYTITGPGTLSGSNVTITGAGTIVVTANVAANTNYTAGSQQLTVNVAKQTPSATVGNPAAISFGTATLPLTGSITYAGSTAPTGPFTFSVDGGTAVTASCTGASSPLSCSATYTATSLAPGSHTVTLSAASDTNFNTITSSQGSFTVNKATVTVTASAPGITYGTATDTLTASFPYSGTTTPTGAMTFSLDGGGGVAASCSAASNVYTCTLSLNTSTLSVGSHNLSATFAGDTDFNGATSSTTTLVVSKITTTVAASAPAISYGTMSDTLTASIPYSAGTAPAGSVTFSVDGGGGLTASCSASGGVETCSYTLATGSLSVGNHNVSASLATDTNYNAATSATVTLVVNKQTPGLTASAGNVAYGTATDTLTASLTFIGSTVPSGAVTFTVDALSAVAATCTGSTSPITCTYTYNSSTLAGGTHTVKAAYAGDTNFAALTSATSNFTVAQQAPTISVSAPAVAYGTATDVITASVTYTGTTAPTGAVTFTVNGGSAVTATCTGSSSPRTCTYTFNTSALAPGSYPLTASIAADTNYSAVSATPGSLVVNKATVIVAATAPAITYGTATDTLTATVSYTGTTAPTGNVTFSIDTGFPQNGTCTGATSPRTCTFTASTGTLSANIVHSLVVMYAGDSNFSSAFSPNAPLTVNKQTPSLVASAGNITYGTATDTLTAILSYIGSGVAPSGQLSLLVDGVSPQTATCTGATSPISCTVSYNSSTLSVGTHTVSAIYVGDTNYTNVTSANGSFSVGQVASTVSLSATNGGLGETVTLTASVANAPSNFSSGTMTFSDNGSVICSAVAIVNNSAQCTSPPLVTGANSFTVVFSGGGAYATSNDNASPLIITVDPPANTGTGSTPPGGTSAPFAESITFPAPFTLGNLALTNYGAGGNAFTIAPGGTCPTTPGATVPAGGCTVNVTFTNVAPGLLTGSISITDSNGNVVGTIPVATLGVR